MPSWQRILRRRGSPQAALSSFRASWAATPLLESLIIEGGDNGIYKHELLNVKHYLWSLVCRRCPAVPYRSGRNDSFWIARANRVVGLAHFGTFGEDRSGGVGFATGGAIGAAAGSVLGADHDLGDYAVFAIQVLRKKQVPHPFAKSANGIRDDKKKGVTGEKRAAPRSSFGGGDLRGLFADLRGVQNEFERVCVLVLLHELKVCEPFSPGHRVAMVESAFGG